MKSFLVKLGKIYKMIRKNGPWNGCRIVFMYVGIFIKSLFGVKSGDILIITGGVGDSAFYRAGNQKEELNMHGFRCFSTITDNPFLLKYVSRFKIFIFHRTIVTPKIAAFLEEIKKAKKEIIFDTDDLVYDIKYFENTDSYQSMNALEKRQYEKGVGEEIVKDGYVKVATTTTSFLANKLRESGKIVYISKNKISNHELEIAEKIRQNFKKKEDGIVRIGYYSGTISHNKDFASITPALMNILEKYEKTELLLAGPLDSENELNKFKDRVKKLPFVPRDQYYENLYLSDINLAPLIKGDPFCESKSEIKFTEPGVLGVPTVAIRNQTFSEAIEDGVDGFLADNISEWTEKISRLIENENLRREMGEKAREKVLREYSNKNSHNEKYYNYLKSKL
ncbi:MAG TPA: glycosyltransferase [Candidatus Moranbacteria bacterium]|nr:glycosyltransferase [Candidatus Moranbacteria bacterium]